MRSSWLFAALVLCAALAALHLWALDAYLYWQYPWFDVLIHFLGGLAIGAFVVGLLVHFRPRLYIAILAATYIGWELFEVVAGVPREANFIFDTTLDLLMDTLGGIAAYVAARFTLWR